MGLRSVAKFILSRLLYISYDHSCRIINHKHNIQFKISEASKIKNRIFNLDYKTSGNITQNVVMSLCSPLPSHIVKDCGYSETDSIHILNKGSCKGISKWRIGEDFEIPAMVTRYGEAGGARLGLKIRMEEDMDFDLLRQKWAIAYAGASGQPVLTIYAYPGGVELQSLYKSWTDFYSLYIPFRDLMIITTGFVYKRFTKEAEMLRIFIILQFLVDLGLQISNFHIQNQEISTFLTVFIPLAYSLVTYFNKTPIWFKMKTVDFLTSIILINFILYISKYVVFSGFTWLFFTLLNIAIVYFWVFELPRKLNLGSNLYWRESSVYSIMAFVMISSSIIGEKYFHQNYSIFEVVNNLKNFLNGGTGSFENLLLLYSIVTPVLILLTGVRVLAISRYFDVVLREERDQEAKGDRGFVKVGDTDNSIFDN